jgi:hypothetical protein
MILKFFTAPENAPFLAALAVLFAMSLVVVAATVMGFIGDASLDAEVEGPAEGLLDALGISSTPSSIFVVVVSSSFFIGGFVTQWASFATAGRFLSGWIAIVPALVFTLLAAHATGRVFKKFKIKEESTAVHSDSFVGKTAVTAGGTSRRGLPAQGKCTASQPTPSNQLSQLSQKQNKEGRPAPRRRADFFRVRTLPLWMPRRPSLEQICLA